MKLNTKGHVGYFGISGSGKSYGAVRDFYEEPSYAIFIDTMRLRPAEIPLHGPDVESTNPKLLEAITEALNESEGKAVIHMTRDKDKDNEALKKILDYFEGFYDDNKYGGVLRVTIDEVDQYSDFRTGFQSAAERGFTKLRNSGIRCTAIAQRITGQCSKNIIGQIREFFFYQMFPGDLDDIGRQYGLPRYYDETFKAHRYKQPPEYCCYRWFDNRVTMIDAAGKEHEITADGDAEGEESEEEEEVEEDVPTEPSPDDKGKQPEPLPAPKEVGEAEHDKDG